MTESGADIIVIGGGMAGLTCANELAKAGKSVLVIDKGRGPGGRMSTRRVETDDFFARFDHGAQYFTVRDPRFGQLVTELTAQHAIDAWDARYVAIDEDPDQPGKHTITDKSVGPAREVGAPAMNSVIKAIAATLPESVEVRFGVRAAKVERHADRSTVTDENGDTIGHFETVICAVPAPQAADLLTDVPDLRAKARSVKMQASWALMLAFKQSLSLNWDAAFVNIRSNNDPASRLSWIARNSSKPGRTATLGGVDETWVAHATADWSERYLELDKSEALAPLTEAFYAATGAEPQDPAYAAAHRWRFALVDQPLTVGSLYDADARIGACGDWCMGARVEGAYLSGLHAARAVLQPAAI